MRKMYGYRIWAVLVAATTCFTMAYGDVINRPSQRAADANYGTYFHDNRDFLPPDRRDVSQANYRQQNTQYNKDRRVDSVRHTYTSTKVDLSDDDRFFSAPTTARSHIKQNSHSGKDQLNSSRVPDLGNRSSNKRKSQAYEQDTRMVYPTELDDEPSRNSTVVLRSRSCFDGLCDEVDDYPTDRIHRILSRSKELKQFFSTKITEVIVTSPPAVDSRFGVGGATIEPLCTTMTHTRFPKSAVNMKNEEQLLVNVENYQQGIAYETCTSPNEACKFSKTFPQDYVSSCTQKYTVRKLMVVGKEADNPIFDDFKIPSCCVCTVQQMTSGKT